MSNFITLRLILQEPKPDVRQFVECLSKEELKKGDYDLLLRKAVESKVPDFRLFCDALVRYAWWDSGRELMSTSSTPRVLPYSSRQCQQPHACL